MKMRDYQLSSTKKKNESVWSYALFLVLFIACICITGMGRARAAESITLPEHLKEFQGGFREIKIDQIETIRLLDHKKKPEIIFLANTNENTDFIKTIKKVLLEINAQEKTDIKLAVLQYADNSFGETFAADDTRKIIDRDRLDQWLRDFGKIAVVKLYNKKKEEYVVLDLNRGRDLEGFSKRLASKLDIGYVLLPISEIGGNYGGNIDVSPNGILYIGDTAEDELIEFFRGKGYKNSLAILSTDWLEVGHVDEHISTIILPKDQKDPCGFALVVASTELALNLLKENSNNDGDFEVFTNNKSVPAGYAHVLKKYGSTLKTIQDYLTGKITSISKKSEANTVFRFQESIQKIINNNVEILKNSIIAKTPACQNIKIIKYPTLFQCASSYHNSSESINIKPQHCHAYLPGSVNMTVLHQHLLIPDPFYPPYRKDIVNKSKENGQTPHLIEDMAYHAGTGEIHCGTNCLANPANSRENEATENESLNRKTSLFSNLFHLVKGIFTKYEQH